MKGNFEQVYQHVIHNQTCFYNPHTGIINPIHGYFVQSPTYVSTHKLPASHDEFKGLVTAAFNFTTLEELWEMNVSLGFIVESGQVTIALFHHFNNFHIIKGMMKKFKQDHYFRCMDCSDHTTVYKKCSLNKKKKFIRL